MEKRGEKPMTAPSLDQQLEQAIRHYIDACNAAAAAAISACFVPDATHYFPQTQKWSSADAIGTSFSRWVAQTGRRWTVDQILTDADRCAAILEWTQFDPPARVLRGVDWFLFERERLRIREIRCYFAARPDLQVARQELQSFDYGARGYPTVAA
jgi:hypothetical protein